MMSRHYQFTKGILVPLIFLLQLQHGVMRVSAYVEPVGYDMLCNNDAGNFTKHSIYEHYLYELLSDLPLKASKAKFHKTQDVLHNNPTTDKLYGRFQCREDISLQLCTECIHAAAVKINMDCPLYKTALAFYFKCVLMYTNRFSLFSSPETYYENATYTKHDRDIPFPKDYVEVVETTMNHAITAAAVHNNTSSSSRHFGTREAALTPSSMKLYGLAQCTPDINGTTCYACLRNALANMMHPFNDLNTTYCAAAFFLSCQLIYKTNPFYNLTSPLPTSPSTSASPQHKNRGKGLSASHIGAIAASSGVGSLLFLSITWICLRRRNLKKRYKRTFKDAFDQTPNDGVVDIGDVESLQYDFNTIKTATLNFSENNKLGSGGFGQVYKGKLQNGVEIAVKRLSKNSSQGTLEFKNEVLLVAKLQHRNLVKLLGFCLSGNEKILIYEFLPKSSLDRFLYDPRKQASLDWEIRFKIITGIARGLLYLHEDSRLKIIHRDLKPSNVLLDQAMDAKIADFGLAKLFSMDQTEGDTKRIVGTYGYMAPEYAMAGQFSVKSDVYSFGVIVLEVVSGQKNRFLNRKPDEEGLLERAWRLWNEEAQLKLTDSSLEDNFCIEEVKMCIHIGLLCIQEDATRRPRMTSVVAALYGESITLPLPNSPHFFTASSVHEDQQIQHDRNNNVYTGATNVTELTPR